MASRHRRPKRAADILIALRYAGRGGDFARGHLVGASIGDQGGHGIENQLSRLCRLTFTQGRVVGIVALATTYDTLTAATLVAPRISTCVRETFVSGLQHTFTYCSLATRRVVESRWWRRTDVEPTLRPW